MFWIMAGAMTVLVAVAILMPFLRRDADRDSPAEPHAAYDLRVYRDQLREVDRDVSRGVLSPDEAEQLRAEIGRKLLDADRALARGTRPGGRGPVPVIAPAVLLALLAAAVGLYGWVGNPRLPDLPLRQRIAAADQHVADRPAQADAERSAPARPAPDVPADYAALVQQLRDALVKRPDDPQGLALLAEHEARLGNFAAARRAQEHLLAVQGDQADGAAHARLAALMIEAAGGVISREAEAQLTQALRRDPANGQANYLQGLLLAQNDRPDLAFPIWRKLVETGRPDDPWMQPLRRLLPDLAWLAGHPDYQLPDMGVPALPGPDAAAVAAAGSMTAQQQQDMIRGMVTQLESRLAAQGGTPEEWARLITSLTRIGNEVHAREIWAEAQTRFAGRPEALATIAAAAASAGLTGAAAP